MPRTLGAGVAAAVLGVGCAVPHASVDSYESFDSSTTFSRTYAAREAQACEAARRTLLSQGYVVSIAANDQVRGRKIFQPKLGIGRKTDPDSLLCRPFCGQSDFVGDLFCRQGHVFVIYGPSKEFIFIFDNRF